MNAIHTRSFFALALLAIAVGCSAARRSSAPRPSPTPPSRPGRPRSPVFSPPRRRTVTPAKNMVDATGPGWKALTEEDFVDVNCGPQNWSWKDGVVHGTGQPVGVIRTRKSFTNFELVAQWRHLRPRAATRESLCGPRMSS